ncbi:hypothetical protein SAMN04488506_1220 [Desemzia incerta]|uniref:Uncharacterized protein n=1 Tax=Desemzia incerta TaxID=82801 RepID=A0A1I5X6S3_9LACT|nr:hypothetical protein [Desemzia incerta]SFQ27526.1 hypothetical protein SAMN04488506_1220 [Desemzia incerta]
MCLRVSTTQLAQTASRVSKGVNGREVTISESTGKLIEFGLLTIFLYDLETSTTVFRLMDYKVNSASNTFSFIVSGNYRFMQMIVKRPDFGDLSKSVSIKVNQNASDVYLKKSEQAELLSTGYKANLMQAFEE